jgi:hypothetical protein
MLLSTHTHTRARTHTHTHTHTHAQAVGQLKRDGTHTMFTVLSFISFISQRMNNGPRRCAMICGHYTVILAILVSGVLGATIE